MTMTTEYIIWGIPPQAEMETLLVSEQAGITSREQAERVAATLTDVHGCRAVRIQEFRFGNGDEVIAAFRSSVNA